MEEKKQVLAPLIHNYSLENLYIHNEEEFYQIVAHDTNLMNIAKIPENNIGKQINNPNLTQKIKNEKNYFYGENSKSIDSLGYKQNEEAIRPDRIKMILTLELILIVDGLIEGSDKFPSFLGIRKCSAVYWTVFSSFILFCFYYAYYSYQVVKREDEGRESVSAQGEFRITSPEAESKRLKIIFVCFMGGIIAGMLGVGGGIVMAPLMLELGLSPKTAAATSNFLLIVTSSAGTAMFMISQQLDFTYGIVFAVPCALASLCGSGYILDYVSRTNKNSFLVYCLFYVMIFSLIILPINGISRAIYDMKSGEDVFEFKSYC